MDPLSGTKIPGALQPLLNRVSGETEVLLRLLKPGQLLRATVLDLPARGSVRLRIGNAKLTAKTPIPFESGQKIALQVEKGLPEPVLRIANRNPGDNPVPRLLQHAMARQIPPKEVQQQAQQIRQLARQLPGAGLSRLPALQQGLKAIAPSGPDVTRLSAATIRDTIARSGLLMEPLLLEQQATPEADHKYRLLQLLRLLRPEQRPAINSDKAADNGTPRLPQADQLMNRLMRLVEGGIARIQGHQAQSLANSEESNRVFWQLDFPLQVGGRQEHLELTIRQEQEGTDPAAARSAWKVEIHFDFEELGKVSSQITLRGKNLHCAFWSDRAVTASRFENALPKLEQNLREAGLEVSAISSLHGSLRNDASKPDGVLDERA